MHLHGYVRQFYPSFARFDRIDAIRNPFQTNLPPHVHSREEESFYILEGEITFQIGEERIVASAGMLANMRVGTPQSFKNESSQPAKVIISVAPAGLKQKFFEFGVPLSEGSTSALPTTKDAIEKLLTIAPLHGIQIRVSHHTFRIGYPLIGIGCLVGIWFLIAKPVRK